VFVLSSNCNNKPLRFQISDEAAGEPCESKEDHAHADEEEIEKSEIDKEEDMAFQLNPEAAEFVPLSPPLRGNRNFLQDYPISGSPLRQTPAMDDISVPTQSEFEEEVCRRPREIDEKDFSSEQYADQRNSMHDMDVSEISSTKAEMGDESMARIMSSTQWQTDLSSQWSEKARDDEGSESEEYTTVMKNNSMTMSYTPGDFKAAFETGVDLNAVHDLNVSSDSAEFANSPSHSPEPYEYDERAHTPLLDNKDPIDHLRASSTPQAINEKLPDITAVFDSDETKTDIFSDLKAETSPMEQLLDISPVNQTDASLNEFLSVDDTPEVNSNGCKSANSTLVVNAASKSLELSELNEFIDPIDHKSQPEDTEFKMHDEQSLLSGESTLSHTESSLPEEPITQDDGENVEFMKEEIYEEQSKEKQELYEVEADKEPIEKSTDPLLIPDTLECTSQSTEITESKMPIPEIPSDTTNNLISMQDDFVSNLSPNTDVEKSTELLSLDSEVQSPESNDVEVDVTIGNVQPPASAGLNSSMENEALLLNKDPDPNLDRSENLLIHDIEVTLAKSEEEQKDSSKIVNVESFDIKQDTCLLTSSSVDTLLYPFDTSMEQQEQHESQVVEEAPLLSDKQIRQEEIKEEAVKVTSTNVTETFEEKIESENIPPLSKEVSTTVSEDIGVMDTSKKEETVVKPIDTELAAEVTAGTAMAIAATLATSIAKSKTTTATAKRSTKTTTATTKATPSTKTMTKSTPTSPSKTFTATARTTVTSSTQSTTAKKPAASSATRPRQLDSSTKSAVPSVGKTTKTTAISAKSATATAKATASPRVGSGTAKPKVTGAASPRPNITGASTERKPTASGDAKPKSAAKPTSTILKTMTSNVKTTLVKSSSTTSTRTSTMTSKPRPASAAKTTSTTAIKQSSTSATTSAPRPKTAPVSSSTLKPRENITRTATTKSPMTDKQSKETVNKQISRAGTLSTSKPSTRLSASGVTSTSTTVKRASGKLVSNTSATSPTKKPTPISKVTSKTSVGIKRTPSSEAKVLQNGILEKKEDKIKSTVITAAGDKLEDDVLRKDASPINMPTDNQLITD
jgi:protein phosphatase 1E